MYCVLFGSSFENAFPISAALNIIYNCLAIYNL